MKHKILTAILIISLIFIMQPSAFAGNVTISDSNFSDELHKLTNTPDGEALTTGKLAALSGDINLSNKKISNIDGIQYLTNANSIDLSGNKIGTIPREIKNLISLVSLDLSGNRLTRLPSNIGELSSLKMLDIRANRLAELTGALKNLSLDIIKCDYNFLDISDGSQTLSIINLISAGEKYYKDQLTPVTNFSAYSPENGKVVLYWDIIDNTTFDNGVIGQIIRYSVLDSSYEYLGEAKPNENTYEISGLDTSKEYTFYVSADYYVKNTKYDGTYTKLYKKVKVKPVPQNTPVMSATPTFTPTATLAPTLSPTVEITAAPQQAVIADNTPSAAIMPTEQPKKTSGLLKALYIIIAVLVIIFVFITLFIIARILQQKSRRNNRY